VGGDETSQRSVSEVSELDRCVLGNENGGFDGDEYVNGAPVSDTIHKVSGTRHRHHSDERGIYISFCIAVKKPTNILLPW
jgi:hypothetical protein